MIHFPMRSEILDLFLRTTRECRRHPPDLAPAHCPLCDAPITVQLSRTGPVYRCQCPPRPTAA